MIDDAPARWRPMETRDLDGVVRVAALAFPHHFEDRGCFADRLALHPQGCFALEDAGEVVGYLIAYPWRRGSAPALNTGLDALPEGADVLYLHDLALDPRLRGRGLARPAVEALVRRAREDGWPAVSLVAANDAEGFWRRLGFETVEDPRLAEKLASYGEDARYMVRRLPA